MLWLAFSSGVMVFIVSLCVGDRPLGETPDTHTHKYTHVQAKHFHTINH